MSQGRDNDLSRLCRVLREEVVSHLVREVGDGRGRGEARGFCSVGRRRGSPMAMCEGGVLIKVVALDDAPYRRLELIWRGAEITRLKAFRVRK